VEFAQEPDADETQLNCLIRVWNHILERCLDTLAAMEKEYVEVVGITQALTGQQAPI
jgi:hypothetical protein